jgi:ubiquinone/menaquinone biosynthesis C-methylase UbiE
MASFGDRYVLSSSRSGHDRLRMLCEIHDPHTQALLRKAGLGPRHRYFEFGCGLGYVARWAATQAAHVTAIDLNDEHLSEARRLADASNLRNIEFIHASIYENGVPPASFDYAFSRWILVHLNRPADVMRKVYEVLKPGGIMVCEEPDVDEVYTEPPSEAYRRYVKLVAIAGANRGVDYSGGRRLHTWAREAGFEILKVGAYQLHYLTGPHKDFWSWTFREAGPALIQDGAITEAELHFLFEGMQTADKDPNVMVGHCRNHQLIARKPV